jgi:hypothetical protein
LEYRFDRLLAVKLEQVYQLLVPNKRWLVGVSATANDQPQEHMNELPRRDLCSRLLRSPEGEPHDHESDCSVEGIRSNSRLSGAG